MRILAFLLMLAIGFSGFTAAAHAAVDMGDHMQTHSASGNAADDTATNHDTDNKAKCMDCTHCCVSHAINQSVVAITPLPYNTSLNASPVYKYSGNYVFSLLRPPKP